MSTSLSGVLTALATPFTPDGQIDENALRRLVDRSIDGGVDGVVDTAGPPGNSPR